MFNQIFQSAGFEDWKWAITRPMHQAIEKNYPDGEVKCIAELVNAVDRVGPHRDPDRSMSVAVDAAFLHGARSQVSFQVAGRQYERELADLLFLGSFVKSGRLQWQRACFVQAKRPVGVATTKPAAKRTISTTPLKARSRAVRYNIDEGQLALLRGFPTFCGVSGALKGQSHTLRNQSGMLGAYGFLSDPDEMPVISARSLASVLGGRGSLTLADLAPVLSVAERDPADTGPWPSWTTWTFPFGPLQPETCSECRDLVEHLLCLPWPHAARRLRHHVLHSPHHHLPTPPGTSVLACAGIDQLVSAWTSLGLGEPWRAGTSASGDRAVAGCVRGLVAAAAQQGRLRTLHEAMRAADPEVANSQPSDGGLPPGQVAILSCTVSSNESFDE